MELNELMPVGIIRKLGKEGRVCVPVELRELMGIHTDDLIEQCLYRQENGELILVIKKHTVGLK
jgi:bifunctional DNA-binding transcriptional regulator/antitoxin component of YhaV-PrlF toxin-antitoxin module